MSPCFDSRPSWLAAIAGVAAFFIAATASAADLREQLQIDGKPRTYALHVPEGQPPAGGFPLVLAFHGGGMQARPCAA